LDSSHPHKRVKLFAGIALEESVQRRLATLAERLRTRGFDARFDAAEKYHLTLAFLGWVDLPRVTDVKHALHAAAAGHEPFDLRLDRIGAFPHERRPRVVWIGSHKQPAAFRDLARSVRSVYEALGFEFKDDAVAHVTIARVKAAALPLPTVSAFNPIGVKVSRLTLFESLPAAGTTRYEVRASVPL
jgi:RNA 2',3'-cyclic 3'-phosphodiesterase